MYAKIIIVGNLGKDPEMRYTPSGQAVTNFSVATSHKYTAGNGEKVEETAWFRVAVWGKQAETCNQYLTKGRPVFIEGRLEFSSWETKEGDKRNKLEVVAERVQFLGGRKDEPQGDGGGGPPARREPAKSAARTSAPAAGGSGGAPPAGAGSDDLNLDDIPF